MNLENTILDIVNVSKDFHGISGSKQHVLENVNLSVKISSAKGKIFSVLAPFGAGKTTLLKIVCGLEKPSIGGVNVTGKKYDAEYLHGKIVFIPEKPSSYPWLNVEQNIKFAAGLKFKEINFSHIQELISLVGLEGYENHFPNDKSLGFRFRISLARALAVGPQLLLLDDPLKDLHYEVKREIKQLIQFIVNKLNISIILTTTNINDSISLSNNIYLMKKNPGMIIEEIAVDRLKLIDKNGDYFTSLKRQIERTFAEHDNSTLISEAKNLQF